MPENRKSPIIVYYTQIVLFNLIDSTELILFITDTQYENIQGKLIASSNRLSGYCWSPGLLSILKSDILEYRVLTRRDLPLYIGMKHTTPLLAQLIKGE